MVRSCTVSGTQCIRVACISHFSAVLFSAAPYVRINLWPPEQLTPPRVYQPSQRCDVFHLYLHASWGQITLMSAVFSSRFATLMVSKILSGLCAHLQSGCFVILSCTTNHGISCSCRSSNTRRRMRLNSSTLYRTMHGQRGRDGKGSITCVAWPAAMMPKRCHHSRHAPVQISFVYGARTLQGRIEHAATQQRSTCNSCARDGSLQHCIQSTRPRKFSTRELMSDISHTPAPKRDEMELPRWFFF